MITFDVVASGHVDGVRASAGIRTLTAKMLKQEYRTCLGGAFRYFDPRGESTQVLNTPVGVKLEIRAAEGQCAEIPPDQKLLIFAGKQLEDGYDYVLLDYAVQSGKPGASP